jgi:ferrous iron transport protein B
MATPVLAELKIALIGNPNTGKSTLFNALSGLQSHVGNYPGVTVEKKIGRMRWEGRQVQLVDLPGTYSLAPRTMDEMVAVNVLLGRQKDVGAVDAVICIVDASNLERNLYLVSQVLDLSLPTVVVLNMWDVAVGRGTQIDAAALAERLGVPVVTASAHRRQGLNELHAAIDQALAQGPATHPDLFPAAFNAECEQLKEQFAAWGEEPPPYYLLERLLLDVGGYLEAHLLDGRPAALGAKLRDWLTAARERLGTAGCRVPAVEARVRYGWAREALQGIVTQPATRPVTFSDRIDRWLTHRVVGVLAFAAVMFVVFFAIYSGAQPLMDLCEAGQNAVAGFVGSLLSPGPLQSLLTDGVVAGVGGVLVFLPQIVLLFLFIALLEDCGYMARAAFLMDKLMTKIGLSGKSFVPLMSSFACAVPGVMATRVIENRRDRMVTILVAPLMSCSARLPVYLLLIGAFIPTTGLGGWLPALVLFAMYSVGILVSIPVAWLLKKTLFRGETPPFVMELPSYKWPSPWIVLSRVYDQGKAFVVRAGTLIFATSILIWAAGYFPASHREADQLHVELTDLQEQLGPQLADRTKVEQEIAAAPAPEGSDPEAMLEREAALQVAHQRLEELNGTLAPYDAMVERDHQLRAQLLEESWLGRFGHAVAPAVRPLGWDWKIGVGVIASFPAREVIIATLGTIYSLGSEVAEDDVRLQTALQTSTWPDGRPVYTIPVALSIMVFFALCAQCASTLVTIRRETNSWAWPAFTFGYMTALAYVAAFAVYQVGQLWS